MERLFAGRPVSAKWETVWTVLVLAVVVIVVSLAVWPSLIAQGRDSTVFAYFGFAVTRGAVPYRDVWDHKPPLVYTFNALAFWLFGPDRVAIWIISSLNTFGMVLLFFWLVRRLFPDQRAWAWLGTVCFVLLMRHPGLTEDGNFTEPYAVIPHLAMLLAGHAFLRRPHLLWAGLFGVFAALAAMGRPTFVGSPLMFWPAVLLARDPLLGKKSWWHWPTFMMLSGLVTIGAILAVFAGYSALRDSLDATFIFSWYYGQSGWSILERLPFGNMNWTLGSVIIPLAPVAFFSIVVLIIHYLRTREISISGSSLRIWLLLGLFADLMLSNVSGRGFPHYFVVVIPQLLLVILLGLSLTTLWYLRFVGAVYLGFACLGSFLFHSWIVYSIEGKSLIDSVYVHPVAVYVSEHTKPGEYVYVWAPSGEINFQAQRLSPAKYFVAGELMQQWSRRNEMIQRVVDDLYASPPVMVVDMAIINNLPPLDEEADDPALQPIYDYVAGHCVLAERIFYELVPIYHCNGFEPRETS